MALETQFVPDQLEAEQRLSGKDLRHFKSRIEKAAHILTELTHAGVHPDTPARILFAGSGLGFIPYILAKHTRWTIFAGDLNPAVLGKFPFVRDRVKLARLDVAEMPFRENTFDVVVYNHVLEHLVSWEALALESYRIVKPDGVLYLATPNLRGLYRPDVPLRVYFKHLLFRSTRRVPRETRVLLHLGISRAEILRLFTRYRRLETLNRAHALLACPSRLKLAAALIPSVIHRHFAPNHVFIGRK